MKTLVIDRSRWRTGRYGGAIEIHPTTDQSMLLNERGYRCCLGFYGQICSLSDHDALNEQAPVFVRYQADWNGRLFDDSGHLSQFGSCSTWQDVAIDINDETRVDDATRESWIAAFFRYVLDIEVQFVGEYPEVSP